MNHLNLITINDFISFAPEVDLTQYDSPAVSGLISQASRAVDDFLQYSPLAEDITDEIRESVVDSSGDLIIRTEKLPIISVSSISVTKGTTTIDLNLSNAGSNRYNIDFRKRYIRYAGVELSIDAAPLFIDFWNLRGQQFYTKTSYRAGWEPSELPEVIKQATVLFMRDILATRHNPTGAISISQGNISYSFLTRKDQKSGLVLQAERLLAPYKRIA